MSTFRMPPTLDSLATTTLDSNPPQEKPSQPISPLKPQEQIDLATKEQPQDESTSESADEPQDPNKEKLIKHCLEHFPELDRYMVDVCIGADKAMKEKYGEEYDIEKVISELDQEGRKKQAEIDEQNGESGRSNETGDEGGDKQPEQDERDA